MKQNPAVDTYIQRLPDWQRQTCQRIRALVHEADPEVSEIIKRKLPFFVVERSICALMGTKDHVNVFVYDPIAPDPEGIINQGHGNKTARAIQIYEGDQINETAFINLCRAVIANNRAGGWRKVQENQG
jgi:hypothetical protein